MIATRVTKPMKPTHAWARPPTNDPNDGSRTVREPDIDGNGPEDDSLLWQLDEDGWN